MTSFHKNKTFATFIASFSGGLGTHRFYLYGKKDIWGWAHFLTLPLSLAAIVTYNDLPLLFLAMPLVLSVLAGFLEALIIGLTPDDKWDAQHNVHSGKASDSGWLLACILVLTLGIGAISTIATIARTSDLLFTRPV